MRWAKTPPLPVLVLRVFSVLEEPGDEVGPFPYSLKLTNIFNLQKRVPDLFICLLNN